MTSLPPPLTGEPPASRRRLALIAVGAAVLALVATIAYAVGRGGSSTPRAASAATSASPTPATSTTPNTEYNDRWTCRSIGELANNNEFDPAANGSVGADAVKSSNPGIRRAGDELAKVTRQALTGELEAGPEANLAIAKAQLELAEACGSLFGDGPW